MTTPTPADRTLDAMRRLVFSFFPTLKFYVVHEYTVHETAIVAGVLTFAGIATDPTFSPQLPTGVPYAPALPGSSAIVPAGTLAYVGFANADSGKPYLVRFGPGLPTSSTVDASATLTLGASAGEVDVGDGAATVIRVGDQIAIAPGPSPLIGTISFIGTSVAAHSKVKA